MIRKFSIVALCGLFASVNAEVIETFNIQGFKRRRMRDRVRGGGKVWRGEKAGFPGGGDDD